jgi:hypothetical protein
MAGTRKKVSFKRADAVIPLPEALAAFRSDTEGTERVKWEVKETLQPEDTFADFTNNVFKTTVLRDEASKFYRNRENIRIRIGFNDPVGLAKVVKDFPEGVINAAEQVRFNNVAKKLGFNTDVLKNGSEKTLGERLAEDGTGYAWNALVAYGLSLVGTKAFNSLLVGVRRNNLEWAETLREMANEVTESVTGNEHWLRSTHPEYTESYGTIPFGFLASLDIATIAKSYSIPPSEVGSKGSFDYEVESDKDSFAPLIIDKSVKLTKTVKGSLYRKYRSDFFGTDIRYPERLLTDPHRRIFGRKKPLDGGIILIDVSGSMSLQEKDIQDILDTAPGALIMAYSHKPSSTGIPNLFILADRGKQVASLSDVKYKNIGNGVDGPALKYAISRRRSTKEPIIWVCDGSVTDSNDNGSQELNIQCAKLVVNNRIVTVPNVDGAIEMFRRKKFVSQDTNLTRLITRVKKGLI